MLSLVELSVMLVAGAVSPPAAKCTSGKWGCGPQAVCLLQ